MPLEELEQRFARGAGCYLLRCGGEIVAFTRCERRAPPRPRLGRTCEPSASYPLAAHPPTACRGRTLPPLLRPRLPRDFPRLGCPGFGRTPAPSQPSYPSFPTQPLP